MLARAAPALPKGDGGAAVMAAASGAAAAAGTGAAAGLLGADVDMQNADESRPENVDLTAT